MTYLRTEGVVILEILRDHGGLPSREIHRHARSIVSLHKTQTILSWMGSPSWNPPLVTATPGHTGRGHPATWRITEAGRRVLQENLDYRRGGR